MNPAIYVRTVVFGCDTQEKFASALETTQASISRYETAGRFPAAMQAKVRALARKRRKDWSDSWFFEVPRKKPPAPVSAGVAA